MGNILFRCPFGLLVIAYMDIVFLMGLAAIFWPKTAMAWEFHYEIAVPDLWVKVRPDFMDCFALYKN